MYLIDQHTKKIMEECKERARAAGLSFDKETLEYIVTNKDLLELSPKVMIPTLYDYWLYDVEVLKEYGKYKLYPSNPYETVINSRPAISFYNDNNPDWLNIMIFYHVLAHIDFFQNNRLFEHTWNDDFVGVALADKREIEEYRRQYGRWADYIIEFSRSIDNITGYFHSLAGLNYPFHLEPDEKLNYYFNTFMPDVLGKSDSDISRETDRYNRLLTTMGNQAADAFFAEVRQKYPEFVAELEKYERDDKPWHDVLLFIRDHSPFMRKPENQWMKSIVTIVHNTAQYFAPQIRSKIANEGWASYWHDNLFRTDDRIKGFESDYARINAGVTSLSRVGLNPYAIGLRLYEYVEDLAEKGKISWQYEKILNREKRDVFNTGAGKGKESIFSIRENFSDFMFINTFVDQDFVDRYNLFVVGKRTDEQKGVVEYYVKSRKAGDYKQMLLDSLYHPPHITVSKELTTEKRLYLVHHFEGKQLYQGYIPDVLVGLEYLWGAEVKLQTTEIVAQKENNVITGYTYRDVLYSCKNKKVTKVIPKDE
jgi:stage V sporulation protein R